MMVGITILWNREACLVGPQAVSRVAYKLPNKHSSCYGSTAMTKIVFLSLRSIHADESRRRPQ